MRLVVALAVMLLVSTASTQEKLAPAKGVFLVAKQDIEGGPFYHSVVLLLAHGDEGTVGLIVNRTTDIPLSEALPELGGGTPHELYFGGPVALDGLMYLFRSDEAPDDDADHVMEDVYYSGERDLLEKLMAGKPKTDEIHLFLGHAGWAPGQLDGELVRGSWDVVPADAFTVFGKDPERMWHELSEDSRVIARSPPRPRSRSSPPGRPSSRSAPAETR